MKIGKLSTLLFFGTSLLGSQLVSAEDSPGNVTTTPEKSVYQRVTEKLALSYYGIYSGASLSNLTSSVQPGVDGTPDYTSPQNFENLVTMGYRVNKDLMIGGIGHFYYFPVGNPVGTGHAIQMLDPILTIQQSNIIKQGGFRLGARLNLSPGVTDGDYPLPHKEIGTVTTQFIMNYDVPNTPLSVGLFTYIRGYVPGSDTSPGSRTYRLYVAPNANYQISKRVSATLWVDLITADRNQGTGFISGMKNADIDIEPGINWDITDNISINPIINIFPSNPTLASTSLRAYLIAKAF